MAKKDEQGTRTNSIFKTAIIATPIAIGGGMGLSNLKKTSSHFGQSVTPTPETLAFPAQEAINSFTNRYASKEHSGTIKNWQLDKLVGFSNNTSLTREQLQTAWSRAANSIDPTGKIAGTLSDRLHSATSTKQVFENIIFARQQSGSLYLQKTINRFLGDLSVLESQVARGKSVELFQYINPRLNKKSNLSLGQIDPFIAEQVQKMGQVLNQDFSISRLSREGLPGSELRIGFGSKESPLFTLKLPEVLSEDPSLVVRGATQQSKYIAGYYGIVQEGKLLSTLNHSQYMAHRALEELVLPMSRMQQLSRRQAQTMANEFTSKMFEPLEWVPTITSGKHQGVDEYISLRSKIMRLRTPEGKAISDLDYFKIMKQGGVMTENALFPLFPGSSPTQIGHGVASLIDTRIAASLIPEAVPFARRPLQALRMQYTPTKSALDLLAQSSTQQRFQWAEWGAGPPTPMMRAAYISSKHAKSMLEYGMSAEGQLLVSNQLAGLRSVSGIKEFSLAAGALGSEIASLIDLGNETGQWQLNKTLSAGTMLGYDPFGQPIVLEQEMNLLQAAAFSDKSKGNFLRLTGLEQQTTQLTKVFGGAKGMAREVSSQYLSEALNRINSPLDNIETIISMDELRKNRGLHYNQMFTSLWDFAKTNMDSGKTKANLVSNFVQSPNQIINELKSAAIVNERLSHEKLLYNIMNLARSAKLTPEQMGGVFGAVPDIFGITSKEQWAKTMMIGAGMSSDQIVSALKTPISRGYWMKGRYGITSAEMSAINKGVATGIAQLFFAGTGGSGAGGIATMEPRMFELFGSTSFAGLNKELQQDLAFRMIMNNPAALQEQSVLTSSLQSLINPSGRSGISATDLLANLNKSDLFLPHETTHISLGKFGAIEVPGSESMRQLIDFKTPEGAAAHMELAKNYKNFIEQASLYEQGKLAPNDLQKSLGLLTGQVARAKELTVTGPGGLLRNVIPGSAALTATLPLKGERHLLQSAYTAGITEEYANRMFSEMENIYGKQSIQEMRSRFSSGGSIAGLVGRHPFIGPYSSQPALFKKIAGEGSRIVFNEQLRNAIITRGQLAGNELDYFNLGATNALKTGNQTLLRNAEAAGMEIASNPIRISPLVGMSGDVDGDIVSAILAGPQLEQSLHKRLSDKSAIDLYEQYSIRSQILKAKAKDIGLPLTEAMAGDVLKLGITESGRLGKVAMGLQRARAAVLGHSALSSQESLNALGLLEWLEQTPISGKHIEPGKELQIVNLLDDLNEAVVKKDANAIAETARSVLSSAKMSGQSGLREGFTIAMEDAMGEINTRFIPGIEVQKASEHIAMSMRAMENQKIGEFSAARLRDIKMGRGALPSSIEAQALLRADINQMSPFGAFMTQLEKPSTYAKLSSEILSLKNTAITAGQKMIEHSKPLLVGTGVALGLATLLSPPNSTLSGPIPDGSSTSLDMMNSAKPGDTKVPTEGLNQPSKPPPLMETPTPPIVHSARLGSSQSHKVRIRASGSDINYNNLTSQLRYSTGGRGRIHSTINDKRSALSPQKIGNILDE